MPRRQILKGATPRPLAKADNTVCLIGNSLPGTMTARSKTAFASTAAAAAAEGMTRTPSGSRASRSRTGCSFDRERCGRT